MSKSREAFRIKNIGRTFVTAQLAGGPVDIRVGETVGPFAWQERSEHLNRLVGAGVIVIVDDRPATPRPAPRTSKSKTESEDTGNGK